VHCSGGGSFIDKLPAFGTGFIWPFKERKFRSCRLDKSIICAISPSNGNVSFPGHSLFCPRDSVPLKGRCVLYRMNLMKRALFCLPMEYFLHPRMELPRKGQNWRGAEHLFILVVWLEGASESSSPASFRFHIHIFLR